MGSTASVLRSTSEDPPGYFIRGVRLIRHFSSFVNVFASFLATAALAVLSNDKDGSRLKEGPRSHKKQNVVSDLYDKGGPDISPRPMAAVATLSYFVRSQRAISYIVDS